VLGIISGFIVTVVSCIVTVNFYLSIFFSFSSDTAIFPSQFHAIAENLRDQLTVATSPNIITVPLVVVLFSLYVCI